MLSAIAAENTGTAMEARAMLVRAVATLKANEAQALAAFNSDSGGFRDHGLYVFCATADGRYTAHPGLQEMNQTGKNPFLKDVKDANGKEIGKEMIAMAKEGHIASMTFMYQPPGSDRPVPGAAWVTRVGDQLCGTS
ncbi:MAG: cache domain-containing protein, partial [Steroidobacteraceae bacterium]